MPNTLMSCGCTTSLTSDGAPVCLYHASATPTAMPSLEGRTARCGCGYVVPSSDRLAFFEYRPTQPMDTYYCGHAGWN
jgi:hypothetical protein